MGATYRGTIGIDATKNPKLLSMNFTDGPDQDDTKHEIYELVADSWTLCFTTQDEIAKTIASRLKITLASGRQEPLIRAGTKNLEAYQLYLQGRFHMNKRTPDGFRKALEYFQQAIGKDPAYALAYTGLAEANMQASFLNIFPPVEMVPKAEAAAIKALELDGTLAEAHVSIRILQLRF